MKTFKWFPVLAGALLLTIAMPAVGAAVLGDNSSDVAKESVLDTAGVDVRFGDDSYGCSFEYPESSPF